MHFLNYFFVSFVTFLHFSLVTWEIIPVTAKRAYPLLENPWKIGLISSWAKRILVLLRFLNGHWQQLLVEMEMEMKTKCVSLPSEVLVLPRGGGENGEVAPVYWPLQCVWVPSTSLVSANGLPLLPTNSSSFKFPPPVSPSVGASKPTRCRLLSLSKLSAQKNKCLAREDTALDTLSFRNINKIVFLRRNKCAKNNLM